MMILLTSFPPLADILMLCALTLNTASCSRVTRQGMSASFCSIEKELGSLKCYLTFISVEHDLVGVAQAVFEGHSY